MEDACRREAVTPESVCEVVSDFRPHDLSEAPWAQATTADEIIRDLVLSSICMDVFDEMSAVVRRHDACENYGARDALERVIGDDVSRAREIGAEVWRAVLPALTRKNEKRRARAVGHARRALEMAAALEMCMLLGIEIAEPHYGCRIAEVRRDGVHMHFRVERRRMDQPAIIFDTRIENIVSPHDCEFDARDIAIVTAGLRTPVHPRVLVALGTRVFKAAIALRRHTAAARGASMMVILCAEVRARVARLAAEAEAARRAELQRRTAEAASRRSWGHASYVCESHFIQRILASAPAPTPVFVLEAPAAIPKPLATLGAAADVFRAIAVRSPKPQFVGGLHERAALDALVAAEIERQRHQQMQIVVRGPEGGRAKAKRNKDFGRE